MALGEGSAHTVVQHQLHSSLLVFARVLILVPLIYFQCAVDQFTGLVLTKGITTFGMYLAHWFQGNFVFPLHACV